MEGGGLPVAMSFLFLMTTLALIPLLTGAISSQLDRRSVAVPMVERTGLTATTAKDRYCNRRYSEHSSSQRRVSCCERTLAYISNHNLVVLHGRDLTTTFNQQKTTASASFRAEVEVLKAFKEGVTEDPLGALSSWNLNDLSACHWKGVTCDLNSNQIIALELQYLSLVGSISWLLGSLQYLQQLDLSGNSFSGEIPISLTNCSNLSHLGLSDNNLTGQIPAQLGDLLNLKYLNLSYNALLGGIIPTSLGNCSVLQFFVLKFTNIEGAIPYTLGKLNDLEIIDISQTAVSGAIPGSLGNCSSLTQVSMGNIVKPTITTGTISKNEALSGELPIEMGSLTRLTVLEIIGSNIGGRFPGWISNLTRLTALALADSAFTGEIPHFLGKFPLELLVVEFNNLTGAFPTFLTNCSNSSTFSVAGNSLEGPIPPQIGLLNKLTWLNMGQNTFSGKIPSSLANCSSLTVFIMSILPAMEAQSFPLWITSFVNLSILYLANVNLHGAIPGDIGKVSQLSQLDIGNNNLTGPIPSSIGNCSLLQNIELSENPVSGELPSDIWLLDQLEWLSFFSNSLTGAIPASIGNLSQLVDFECSDNLLTGVIPTEIGSLTNLLYLDMEENSFSSYIPPSLGNMSTLAELYLSQNQLIGPIPTSLGNLTELQGLYLFENRLQGLIPVDLMRCTQLIYFQISENFLSGNIPDDIGNLQSLQKLLLDNNKLFGVVPDSLGKCINLREVNFSGNSLYGVLPPIIFAQLSTLSYWNVSHNHLAGILPEELAQLRVVTSLDFSANNFSGSIPSGLGACLGLISLDLSINNLSGSIPQTLTQLKDLTYLNVSDNNLEGAIPDGGIFATDNLTAASFFGNDGLCGSIISRPCADAVPSNSTVTSNFRAFQCASIRIAVGCGAAALFFLVLIFMWWFWFRKGKLDTKKREQVVTTFERGLRMSKEDLVTIMGRPENIIGVGAKSTVYKGILGGDKIVAIKTLSIRADDSDHDYKRVEADILREAHTLSKLRHRNILKVLGLFHSQEIVALVTEFMTKGSLHDQLYRSPNDGSHSCDMNWEARLNIAVGVAHGLVYLHNQVHEPVIHGDLKPSNIFLDETLEPKLGDFGVSKFVKAERNGEATASTVCGTVDYIPPEYAATTKVSTKGDVYSYGVILLELLTRRHPILFEGSEIEDSGHLVDWVLESFEEQPMAVLDNTLIDENMNIENQMEQMQLLMRVGLSCTREDPQNRPHMTDVLGMVNQIVERGSGKGGPRSVAELAEEIIVWNSEEGLPPSISRSS